jgi:hypothetical protein
VQLLKGSLADVLAGEENPPFVAPFHLEKAAKEFAAAAKSAHASYMKHVSVAFQFISLRMRYDVRCAPQLKPDGVSDEKFFGMRQGLSAVLVTVEWVAYVEHHALHVAGKPAPDNFVFASLCSFRLD